MSALATERLLEDELLTDSAALVSLLGEAAHAFMLDEHDRVENLLGQVTLPACRRIAGMLRARARIDMDIVQ